MIYSDSNIFLHSGEVFLVLLEPKIDKRKSNEILVIAHSKKLVEFFIKLGLKPGDKIKNQVTIPQRMQTVLVHSFYNSYVLMNSFH